MNCRNLLGWVCLWLLSVCAAFPAPGGAAAPAPAPTTEEPTFWLIPHTHWEGAVFKTREEYLEMGLPNILTALRLLKEHPDYRFTLDQAAYFKPFLERYPEEAAAFRRFVGEGRLEIVGGLDVMPDDNMPGGESFLRQILYAKGYCRRELGVEVRVGWLLDTFGHHAQLPQILRGAGYQSFWFFRGVRDRGTMPSEFLWEGLDGTRIPAFWLPFAYGHLYGPPRDLPRFTDFMKKRYDALAPFARGPDRVGLAGVDVSEPELHVAALVEQFNRQTNRPFRLRIGVPSDFEQVVARRADLPVVMGERNPLFQGIYSSRIELKQRMREMERLLGTMEKAGALAQWLGEPIDEAMAWQAWEPALFNVTHDLASGVMTDQVYEDTLRGYDFAQRLAEETLESRLTSVLGHIDTRGAGVPVVVFNTLGWTRTEPVEADVGFAQSGVQDFTVVDATGASVPSQLLSSEPYRDGGLKRVKLAFVARAVPAVGYALYRVVPSQDRRPAVSAGSAETNLLENQFYALRVDLQTGTLTNLWVKDGGWEALAGPGNVVVREPDHGDFWELYRNLDGFQNVMMTRPLGVPARDKSLWSSDPGTDRPAIVSRRGAVFSELRVSRPFGGGVLATAVRLYTDLPRVEFETTLLNREKFVRYRMLTPTTVREGKGVHEIPFGAVERPGAQEYPAQNWIDWSNGRTGVALLNRGLPGNNVADGTLLLSLLRSTRIQNYGIGGGFEGQASDSGLELGKELTFRYALVPHAGDWRAAAVFQSGLEFNQPLVARKATPHPGRLPARWGLLDLSPPHVVLSALKPSPRGTITLRVYEAAGQAVRDAALTLHQRLQAAYELNLMEDRGAPLKAARDTVRFSLRPFEIKTIELKLRPAR